VLAEFMGVSITPFFDPEIIGQDEDLESYSLAMGPPCLIVEQFAVTMSYDTLCSVLGFVEIWVERSIRVDNANHGAVQEPQ
jgi:hypothetical protein